MFLTLTEFKVPRNAVEDFEKLRAAIIIVYKHIDSIRYDIYDSGDSASKSECRSSGLNCDGYQDGITIRIYVNGDSDGFTLYLEAIKYGSGWYIADMYWWVINKRRAVVWNP